jgi:hypothetical protein
MPEDQSTLQKKIAFANSEHVAIVVQIMQECSGTPSLVGENEFATIVNAVTLDAQSDLIKKFINSLDAIKQQNFTPS